MGRDFLDFAPLEEESLTTSKLIITFSPALVWITSQKSLEETFIFCDLLPLYTTAGIIPCVLSFFTDSFPTSSLIFAFNVISSIVYPFMFCFTATPS